MSRENRDRPWRPTVVLIHLNFPERIRRSTPAVVSLLLHLLLVLLIGSYFVRQPPERVPSDSVFSGLDMIEDDPGEAPEQKVTVAPRKALLTAARKSHQPAPDLGLRGAESGRQEKIASKDLLGALNKVEQMQAQRVAAYRQRTAKGRKDSIRRFGGSGATESAVERGLDWLSRHQDRDGRWDSNDYLKHCRVGDFCRGKRESRGFAGYDVAQTGLALLAFMGAGYTHKGGPHRDTVKRGLGFLLRSQRPDGSIRLTPAFGAKFFYSHAIATFALAEAYGLTRDKRLRNRIRNSVRFIERSQNLQGGWNYKPAAGMERNDSSVTGWVVMALESARLVGVHVSTKTLVGAIGHFRRLTTPDGMLAYTDSRPRQHAGSNAITAVGLLSRLILGQSKQAKVVQLAAELMAQDPPDASLWHQRDQCLYYWYYGSLAAFMMGGETWISWNASLKPALLGKQLGSDHGRGSWPAESKWARQGGGRIYATAMSVLCLEVYYKYVPSLVRDGSKPLARHWLSRADLRNDRQTGDWKQEVKKLYSGSRAAK